MHSMYFNKMADNGKPVVFDNWEDLEEPSALKEQLASRMQANASMNGEVSTSCQHSREGPVEVMLSEETRARCSLPPVPVVKILKRPSKRPDASMGGGDGLLLNGDTTKPRLPVKTLQQREEEYAQARLRILGEAQSPDEDLSSQEDEKVCRILMNKLELMRPNTISRLNCKDFETEEQQNSTESPQFNHWESNVPNSSEVCNLSNFAMVPSPSNLTTASSSNFYDVNSIMSSRSEDSSHSVRISESNIIRQPRGPNGTVGFEMRR